MKGIRKIWMIGAIALGMIGSLKAQQNVEDKTLSPYFLVMGDGKTDQLPLKHTSAEVNIAGVIADVTVKQVYVNKGENPLEAIYVFPGSTKSAVYAMTMTIGERRLSAKIEEKGKAREIYEQAKEDGKTASLLEQQRPNVFQMNVANILPGDSITVEMRYTEMIVPTSGVYEFAYPTVVGPRYSTTLASQATANEKWVANPYLQEGELPTYTFNIGVILNAGIPIQEVICPSHQSQIQFKGANQALVELDPADQFRGNKDFIIRYRLSGGQIESGMLIYEGENMTASSEQSLGESQSEKFFMVMLQPPKAPSLDQIPPREYVFIVDVSGSMHGFPLGIAKDLLKNLIGNLRSTDRFNVMLFESNNAMLAPESMLATTENINKAIQVIEQQSGGGGTNLLPALKNALNFKESRGFSRSFVVITDGYVTVEKEAFDLIRGSLNKANLFSFGIGSSVNRYLIEGMAYAGMGEPFVITQNQEAAKVAEQFRNYIQTPVLTNIQVQYDGFDVYDIEPLSVPDVFAERPVVVFGKFRGQPKGTITLTGMSGQAQYQYQIDVSTAQNQNNQALRYLWARHKIRSLADYTKLTYANSAELIKQITDLGLQYNLLTDYTSFVAVDDQIRNAGGKQETVQQTLPLPEGVSNLAIGPTSSVYGVQTGNVMYKNAEKRKGSGVERNSSISYVAARDGEEVDEVLVVESPKKLSISRKAEPVLGWKAWENYLKNALQMPEAAKTAKIKGEVVVTFDIDENGVISNLQVTQGLGYGCDEEAIRLIKAYTGWLPEINDQGIAVKTTLTVKIKF